MNVYQEYFYVPKHGKVSEKVMVTRVCFIVATIILCLFAMSYTAFAYFSHNASSSANALRSAYFDMVIAIDGDGDGTPEIATGAVQQYSTELKADVEYTISIKRSPECTAKTGFCILQWDGLKNPYHTTQLGRDGAVESNELSFKIKFSKDTTVTFLAHWGTSSYYGYQNLDENPLYIRNETKLLISP